MNEILKKVLVEIDFKNRFDALFEKHSHRNLFKKANPSEVQKIIEKLGHKCTYYKRDKFFKIDDDKSDISLNLSTNLGIVEFILDAKVDEEGTGGPFGYMSTFIESEERIKKPRFATYEELEEILEEGIKLYDGIKKGLLDSRA